MNEAQREFNRIAASVFAALLGIIAGGAALLAGAGGWVAVLATALFTSSVLYDFMEPK